MKIAVAEGLEKSVSYAKYRATVTALYAQGQVSGHQQSEELLHYTHLNETRMNRLDKKTVLDETVTKKLLALEKKYIWLVLSEGWCGDAAQIVPVLNAMASVAPNVEMRVAFRDDNPLLMEQFLTNGARSIPKLIVLDADAKAVLGSWGPRPKGASDLITSYKRQYGSIDETAKTELQLWYTHDKGLSIQLEVADLMTELERLIYSKR